MTELLPLSLLNDFLYCPRRAALKLVEGWRGTNEHTLRGDIVHEHADLPGYESQVSESGAPIMLWRALPVWSERLGLSGKCDIVEAELKSETRNPKPEAGPKPEVSGQVSEVRCQDARSSGWGLKPETRTPEPGNFTALRPVEFKLGKRRQWENDDVQLCAQALCLEEMFGLPVVRGAVYHAKSKRRREVEFTPELRARTEATVGELHALLDAGEAHGTVGVTPPLPPAVHKPTCEECSLFDICLPAATGSESRAPRMTRRLFEV